MRKKQIAILLFCLILTGPVLAFQNLTVNAGERKVAYYLMPDQSYATPSSALVINYGMDEKLSLEFDLVGYKSWYLLTPYTYQFGLHSNYKFFDAGGLKFTGMTGLGGLYAGNLGASLGLDFGISASAGTFSAIILPTIFSDGILMAYGAVLGLTPPLLNDTQILLGARGNMTVVTSDGRFGFSNRLYGIIGLEASL